MIRPLITHPNDVLRGKNEDIIDVSDSKLKTLVQDMRETMIHANGVGIAATQVGIALRVAIVAAPETKERVIINPRILRRSWKRWSLEEGCLSVPGSYGDVRRPWRIRVRYQDLSGKEHIETAEGMLARVFQHEIDHLDGMLFIDRAKHVHSD